MIRVGQQFCRSRRPVVKQFTDAIARKRRTQTNLQTISASRSIDSSHSQPSDATVPGVRTLSDLLNRPALVIGRQMEYLNIFLGFEQANRYVMYDAHTATPLGYILEDQQSLLSAVQRQVLRTHRPFTATIMSTSGDVLLRLRRPFQLINSRLYVKDADGQAIGEVQQQWHLLRRKYDLFVGNKQFAEIDAPFLSWDFTMQDGTGAPLASVNKNFTGFGRELFTDSSQYVIRLDGQTVETSTTNITPQIQEARETAVVERSQSFLSVEERAVALACAISIDFDYFSRHSAGGGLAGWLPISLGGGSGAPEAAVAEDSSSDDSAGKIDLGDEMDYGKPIDREDYTDDGCRDGDGDGDGDDDLFDFGAEFDDD